MAERSVTPSTRRSEVSDEYRVIHLTEVRTCLACSAASNTCHTNTSQISNKLEWM